MKTGLFTIGISFFMTALVCSCGPKENEITIDITSPIDGTVDSVKDIIKHYVYVDFSSTKGFASCTLRVFLADNPDEEVDAKSVKPTANGFEFEMPVDFRYKDENGVIQDYPSGTEFILEATACGNEDCVFPVKKQSRFTIAY